MADDTDALVEQWGQADVDAAFWLQKEIKNRGIEGIGYMEAARKHLRATGEDQVKQKMKEQMEQRY